MRPPSGRRLLQADWCRWRVSPWADAGVASWSGLRARPFWGTPATLQGQRRGGRFPPLDRLDLRRVTKIVLFPVRFLFTAQTGQVGTNTLAARHYLASPNAPASSLVAAALAWRLLA